MELFENFLEMNCRFKIFSLYIQPRLKGSKTSNEGDPGEKQF